MPFALHSRASYVCFVHENHPKSSVGFSADANYVPSPIVGDESVQTLGGGEEDVERCCCMQHVNANSSSVNSSPFEAPVWRFLCFGPRSSNEDLLRILLGRISGT